MLKRRGDVVDPLSDEETPAPCAHADGPDPQETGHSQRGSDRSRMGRRLLGWRAVDTWEGTDPALFLLLYACELFGWAMLVSFCFLAWRIPTPKRPPIGRHAQRGRVGLHLRRGTRRSGSDAPGLCRDHAPPCDLGARRRPQGSVRYLAERTGARYVSRADNRHAKAGNINHALEVVNAELLLVLDADHVPQPDILDATVGYFDDPKVAVVQTPHDFSNHDSFQHFETGRHDQSMFFEVILPGKDRHNSVFWCGSAAVIRREALVEVGGVATETIAEDFHTTIKLHVRGWKSRYHGETLVQGLAPHNLSSYLLQRDRWARGNLAVFRTAENPAARAQSVGRPESQLPVVLAGVLRASSATGPPGRADRHACEWPAPHACHPVGFPHLLVALDRIRPCCLGVAVPGTSHPVGRDLLASAHA